MKWVFLGIGFGLLGVVALVGILNLVAVFVALFPVPKVPLRYNFRNLQVRWLTALVTALAITLVVALLTVMLAFVKGMQALTEGSGNPANLVILQEGTTDEVMSKLANISVAELPDAVQGLISKKKFQIDGKDVEDHLVSREVYAIVTQMTPTLKEGEYKKRFIQMRGIEKPHVAAEVHDIKLLGEKSRWFDGTRGKQAVLGHGIAKLLGEDQGKTILEPGDTINLRGDDWTVVGVMSPAATTFGSEVWTDDQVVQKFFGRESTYSSYVVRINEPKKMEKVTEVLKNRDLVSFQIQAQSEKEYYSKLSQTNQQFSSAINMVAIVMAIGGLLGVMITMFSAVSQRSKDIGVLRLLGYRRWQILCSFQLEALLIGIIGGMLGVLIGSLFNGMEANSIVTGSQGGGKSIILKLTIGPAIILQGFIFSVFMGSIGGVFPAISAMRLRPLESLR